MSHATPKSVVEDSSLTLAQKVEILRQWEYDQREISVALEEGMNGPEPEFLASVVAALEVLLGSVDLEHGPPTKQGGSSPP